jgi:ATP-dependent protease ClpP protease subunit
MNEIHLYGTVGDSFWNEDYFTASMVRDQIRGMTGPLTVHLNSGGGVATEGQAIYTMLKDYPGEVEVVVDGVAASAASLIAMAGDKITMRLGSWMLIHDPAVLMGYGRGTADDHRELAGFLDKLGDAYAEVYAARTGMTAESAREIMRAETVYLGAQAVAAGFATDFEGNTQAAAAAAFDYRIYAHAPESARGVETRGERPGMVAVMAMIAGQPRQAGEPPMANTQETAAGTTAARDDEDNAEAIKATEPGDAVAPVAKISTAQANRMHIIAAHLKIPAAAVARIIDSGVDHETALDQISALHKETGDVDIPMHGRPTARILRDDREVRNVGMTEALFAQLSRTAPETDRARPFMDMRLADMAAICGDYKGPMRSARDLESAFMAGSHSTSDFPAIFSNALNKQLENRYRDAAPTYRNIARRVSFNDFRPHPQIRTGDFPMLQGIAEGGEIKFGTFSEKQESVAVQSYAVGVRLTRQMLINDDLSAIAQVIADQGRMVARKEDALFYAMMLSGANANGPTLLETTRQVFNATDGTLAGTPAAITVASLGLGRAALRKRKSLDGADLDVSAAVLLVGPDKELEAQQVVAPIQAQQAGNVNPFSGTLQVVTTAKLTGNSWYLFANPADVPNFVYGFLSGYEAPRMRMDEPFGYQGTALTIEHDFGVGAVDFRGGYRNAGA